MDMIAKRLLIFSALIYISFCHLYAQTEKAGKQQVSLIMPGSPNARISFGANKLADALRSVRYTVKIAQEPPAKATAGAIIIGAANDKLAKISSFSPSVAGESPG